MNHTPVKVLRHHLSVSLRTAAHLNDHQKEEALELEMAKICQDWQLLSHELKKGIEETARSSNGCMDEVAA